MHPKDLSISDFTYHLPAGRIAQQPLKERDQAKLLIYKNGKISESVFSNLTGHLPEKSMLVFNDTKVVHARILFRNEHRATIEVFLLEPVEPERNMQLAMFSHGSCTWRCLVGNVKKWREEKLIKKIEVGETTLSLEVTLEGKIEDDFLVHFTWQPESLSFAKVVEMAGRVPLPPYIKRKAEKEDEEEYQTLYAVQDGSVAAPTAGLHFTESIFEKLSQRDITLHFVTLHVGAGTFLPVKSTTMREHNMHAEQFAVRRELIISLLEKKVEPVVAVGTTSLRTIESLHWLGVKTKSGGDPRQLSQWEAYEFDQQVSNEESLSALLRWMDERKLLQLIGETKLLISPGYRFRLADGLITNFHLPGSTLLLLVAAFIGEDWRRVYDYALHHEFRFLSYGDGSLLWKN